LIRDGGEPNAPGAFRGTATITTNATLIGKTFADSRISQPVNLRYPVELSHVSVPSCISPGEVERLSIRINNLVNVPFGMQHSLTRYSASREDGSVVTERVSASVLLCILVHASLSIEGITASDAHYCDGESVRQSLAVMHDGIDRTGVWSIYRVPIDQILAKQSLHIEIQARMSEQAVDLGVHSVRFELVLQERFVQYEIDAVRSVRWYQAPPPSSNVAAPVLLVTGRSTTAQRYALWREMLRGLALDFATWDIDRQHGLSYDSTSYERHQTTWVGRTHGGLIIMLADHCTQFEMMSAYDLATHFLGVDWEAHTITGSQYEIDSGMLCLNTSHEAIRRRACAACSDIVAISGDEFGDNSLGSMLGLGGKPADASVKAAALRIVEKLNNIEAHQHQYSVRAIAAADAAAQAKRQYGTCFVGRSALAPRQTRLIACEEGAALAVEREYTSDSTTMHYASPFASALLYVVAALPLKHKLEVLLFLGSVGIVASSPAAAIPSVESNKIAEARPLNRQDSSSEGWFTRATFVGLANDQAISFVDLLLGAIFNDLSRDFTQHIHGMCGGAARARGRGRCRGREAEADAECLVY
jgi:hypothetical protein